jgi:transketolase
VPDSLNPELEQQAISLIRGFAMDAPLHAKSGHQGTAMALAPLAHVLYSRIMRHDPADPHWVDRDRFMLSNGHASILQYSMLYLPATASSSTTSRPSASGARPRPATPRCGHTAGVEVTTGPLGQGFANAVGMAHRRAPPARPVRCRRVRPPHLRDGRRRLLHGGRQPRGRVARRPPGLGGLVCIYDDNHITIDGDTELTYSDDVAEALRGVRLARRAPRRDRR